MTRDDPDIVRWRRRLKDAETERDEVRRRGAARAPQLERLETEYQRNQFAARFIAATRQNRRRT